MTVEEIARLEHAETILTTLYWDIRDSATKTEVNRLDTILAKLYELKHVGFQRLDVKKRRG